MTDDLSSFVRGAVGSLGFDDEVDDPAPIDERPDDIVPEAWARLDGEQRAQILAARADEGQDEDEEADEAPAPLSGRDLQEAVRDMVADVLEDPDGAWAAAGAEAGMDPADWAIWIATAPAADWAAYCRDTGWRPEVRPGRENLPVELQTELTRRNLYANLERERKGYERGSAR